MPASPVARSLLRSATPAADAANYPRRRNFLHLYGDAFWAGIGYGSVLTFVSVYAARLGAVEWQLGLLSAMPPLTILLLAALAGGPPPSPSITRSSSASAPSAW